MNDPLLTQLGRLTAVAIGAAVFATEGDHACTVTVTGTGSVSATALWQGSNDAIGWVTLATLSPSGTSVGSAKASTTETYRYWRLNVTALTGDAVSAAVSSEAAGTSSNSAAVSATGIAGILGARGVAMVGQSNERGSARTWAGAGNQAQITLFSSNNGLADPIAPSVSPLGSVIPHLDALLRARGYNLKWTNCAIGGSTFIKQWCGQVFQWAANTTFFGQRASIGTGDAGDYGDVIVSGTRVLRCTTGAGRYATNNSGAAIPSGGGATNLDYILVPAALDKKTGATQPVSDVGGRAMSAALVGDTFTETTGMVWTCLSTTLGTLSAFKVLASGEFGFDPLGLMVRTKTALDALTNVTERWVFMANGQSDAQGSVGSQSTIRGWYAQAIRNMVNYFTSQGYKVAVGFTCFNPNAPTFADATYPDQFQTLRLGIDDAFGSGFNTPANVVRGGDLYALWGYNVQTYPEPPSITISGTNAPHLLASQYPAFAQEWASKLAASGAW